MKTILFQGDSITDAQRIRNDPSHLGSGYPLMVAGILGMREPGKYSFVNRGISGNKSVDVAARIDEDIIKVSPDVMSLMVGVNDVWHGIDYNWWATPEDMERSLTEIIERTKDAFPNVLIMLLEPYLLREYATDNTDEKPDKWERFRSEVAIRQEITKRYAEKYSLPFIPLQKKFEEAAAINGVKYFTEDGVHPSPAGHLLIAHEWVAKFDQLQ